MRKKLAAGIAALSIGLLAQIGFSEVVYEQAPLLGANMVQPGDGGFWGASEAAASGGQASTGFYDSSLADNFTLSATDTITNVAWTGYIENYLDTDDSNIAGFVIDFYKASSDPYNFNNSPIYQEYDSLADCNAVVDENPNAYGTTTYSFDVNLSTPQTFAAGQEYFVGINAVIIDPNNSSYFWSGGVTNTNDPVPNMIAVDGYSPDNGYSYDVIWPDQFGNPNSQPHDLAFTLSDANPSVATVPLPPSIWGGTGLIGLIAAKWLGDRRKKISA